MSHFRISIQSLVLNSYSHLKAIQNGALFFFPFFFLPHVMCVQILSEISSLEQHQLGFVKQRTKSTAIIIAYRLAVWPKHSTYNESICLIELFDGQIQPKMWVKGITWFLYQVSKPLCNANDNRNKRALGDFFQRFWNNVTKLR